MPSEFEQKLWEGGLTAVETKGVGMGVTVRGTEVAVKVMDHEFALVKTGSHEYAEDVDTLKVNLGALSAKVKATIKANPLVNAALELGPGHIP